MSEIIKSIVHKRRVIPQPTPNIVSGGDCGACVLGGLLDIKGSNNKKKIKNAYLLQQNQENLPKEDPFNLYSMRHTLEMLTPPFHIEGFNYQLEHSITEIPIWPMDYMVQNNAAFGLLGCTMFRSWTEYLKAMMYGGYYGITQVKNNGYNSILGNMVVDYPSTDHWIMICGWREVKKELDNGLGSRYDDEILISNSATTSKKELWIEVQEFLKTWGGFTCMYAKPITDDK